jgi:hypothetical protein
LRDDGDEMVKIELERQVFEMAAAGIRPDAAEVGPETWDSLLDICEAGTGKKWPPGHREKLTEGQFMGITIRRAPVPEGRLYPICTA